VAQEKQNNNSKNSNQKQKELWQLWTLWLRNVISAQGLSFWPVASRRLYHPLQDGGWGWLPGYRCSWIIALPPQKRNGQQEEEPLAQHNV